MIKLPFATLRHDIHWWWDTPNRLIRDLKALDEKREDSEFAPWWDYPQIRKCHSCGEVFPDVYCHECCDKCFDGWYPKTHLLARLKFAKQIFSKKWHSEDLRMRTSPRAIWYLFKFLICILLDFVRSKSEDPFAWVEVAVLGCTQDYGGDYSCEVLYVGEGIFSNWWWDYDWNA
ncbi:hypothetical protein [Halodesulfovibrio sp.]|uniref:hypothetical protein n=1 Tax=Halodesulfovibrio sp. TaxID=1912772 RepID=UPI0025BC7594|nr:hypothetical protein [Halodesulfovibrio sp.]